MLGLTRITHEAMVSALSKAIHGLLIPDRQIARLYQARRRSTRLNQTRIRSLPQLVLPSMRQPVPHPLCRSHPCRVSRPSTRPLKCAPLIQRLPRVSLLRTSSRLRQALKPNPCPTISLHRSVTVSRHHHTQLQRYVRQKFPPNMMTRSVVANRRRHSFQKALRLLHPTRFKKLFESSHSPLLLLKSQSQLLAHRLSKRLSRSWRRPRCRSLSPGSDLRSLSQNRR